MALLRRNEASEPPIVGYTGQTVCRWSLDWRTNFGAEKDRCFAERHSIATAQKAAKLSSTSYVPFDTGTIEKQRESSQQV